MVLKKLLKRLLALFLICTLTFVSYAMDIDTVFGIKAGAEDYSSRATSLLEFYKTGSALDISKISSDELYVFGVFVSNFLMPFQSVIGNMSSDGFAAKLAETFFGSAYTAQQFSDMQYTLGLVQSAQAGRKRIVSVTDGTTCSFEVLLRNFGGFYSRYQDSGVGADPILYKYEGGTDKDIVWQVNSDMFDAIVGQVISVCPTQAGAYVADDSAVTRQLYVDCFGNISDAKGIVIIPACMNPYSFVNGYLTADRQVSDKIVNNDEEVSKKYNQYACPLQLPINNAFWMGCMVTPQDLVAMVKETVTNTVINDDGTKTENKITTTTLKKAYVPLPMLYEQVDKWSKSTTVLIGLDSIDGAELGIYFSNRIFDEFKRAYRVARGIDDGASDVDGTLLEDMPNIWNYVGGTSIPITAALADIALFNTYAPFSDSLASTITAMNMYLDSNDAWWASDESQGDSVKSLYTEYIEQCNLALENNADFKKFSLAAQLYIFYCRERASEVDKYDYNADPCLTGILCENKEGNGSASGTQKGVSDNRYVWAMLCEIAQVAETMGDDLTSTDKLIANWSKYSKKVTINPVLPAIDEEIKKETEKSLLEHIIDAFAGGEKENTVSKALSAWSGVITPVRDVIYSDKSPWAAKVLWSNNKQVNLNEDTKEIEVDGNTMDFILRTILSLVMEDPLYLFPEGSPSSFLQMVMASDGNNKGNGVLQGTPIKNSTTVGWWGTYTYNTHYFLQKAHVTSERTATSTGWLRTTVRVIVCISLIVCYFAAALVAILTVATIAVPAFLVAALVGSSIIGIGLGITLAVYEANHGGSVSASATRLLFLATHTYGMSRALAILGLYTLVKGNGYSMPDEDKALIDEVVNGDTYLAMCKAYGLSYDPKEGGTALDAGNAVAKYVSNYAVSAYTLYSPYKSLANSLSAIAKVYTEQGIVSGDSIKTAVGSYITNDVNLWGGIYYAYMIDIFGLTISAENEMKVAKLKTNLPEVPNNRTGNGTLDMAGIVDSGNDLSDEENREATMQTLMNRLLELTDTNDSSYRDDIISKTVNSFLGGVHNDIVNADSTGSIDNVGSGNLYTGYSGYITTSTLAEMPFTSWIMQSYDVIYIVLMLLIIVLAICMMVTGHRTWRKAVFSAISMAVILFIPRISVDSAVTLANNTASALYKDRFSFWAYAQHQQYANKLASAQTQTETLIIQNIQQAKDYYDSGSGVTVKWMSPKKSSYWDKFTDVTGGSDSGLNLSLFTWLFQGQFRQEIYSTDNLATYLYRPYLDIVNTAESATLGAGTTISDMGKKDSLSERAQYAYYTSLAWDNCKSDLKTNWDIVPSIVKPNNSDGYTTISSTFDSTKQYASGIVNKSVNDWAYSHYVSSSSKDKVLEKAYPAISKGKVTVGVPIPDSETDKKIGESTQQFLLYTESPYYYFYFMLKDMAAQYEGKSDSPVHHLLVDNYFYKYAGEENYIDPVGGGIKESSGLGTVAEGEIKDFLDLEDLFTYVIPYLQQSNMYVTEWSAINGTDIDSTSGKDRKEAVRNIWSMYSPWVDAMYAANYHSGSVGSVGKKYDLMDTINPGYYLDHRQMIFSPADKVRNSLTDADLSDVEARIIRTLEDTYTDFMYLNNYASFDEDVLLHAMAMTATFNFNKNFSENNILGDSITLYPTGFEVRNFSYDAYLRMALLNTTGSSVFSDKDIYTEVIENTSMLTGLLLIVNDAVAVYGVPTFKLVTLLLLFFLGLMLCINCFLSPPDKLWVNLAKSYFAPFGIFLGALFAHMIVISLFVGEGMTGIVGSRGVTITTGDPTITIILMLVVNCLFCFVLFKAIKMLLKAFKMTFKNTWSALVGIGGAVALGAGALIAGGKSATRAVGSGIKAGVNKARHKQVVKAINDAGDKSADGKTSPAGKSNSNKGEYKPRRAATQNTQPEAQNNNTGAQNQTPEAQNPQPEVKNTAPEAQNAAPEAQTLQPVDQDAVFVPVQDNQNAVFVPVQDNQSGTDEAPAASGNELFQRMKSSAQKAMQFTKDRAKRVKDFAKDIPQNVKSSAQKTIQGAKGKVIQARDFAKKIPQNIKSAITADKPQGNKIANAMAKARLNFAKAKYATANTANKALGVVKVATSKEFRSALANNVKTDVALTAERVKQTGARYIKAAGNFTANTARKVKNSVQEIPQNVKSSAQKTIQFAKGKVSQAKQAGIRYAKSASEFTVNTARKVKQAGIRYAKSASEFTVNTARKVKDSVQEIPQNVRATAQNTVQFAKGKANQVKNIAERKIKRHEELEAARKAERDKYSISENSDALRETRSDAEAKASEVRTNLEKRALQRKKQLELLRASKPNKVKSSETSAN